MLTSKDEAFLKAAQDLGFLTAAGALECQASLEAIGATGAKVSVSKLLQDKGQVTQEKLTAITAELRKRAIYPNVGPYDVLTRLGTGGSATVYKALDPESKRVVALKVLAPALGADVKSVQRFLRGAELAAKVKHENVAETYEVARDGTRYYIAMEFVLGVPLSEMATAGKPLSEADALHLIKQIAGALATCHAQGIIHRDVKPSNIMVTPSGTAKLLDLGLARPTESSQADVTMSGNVVGTPHFMSPEQCAGSKDVDERADIYSMGATLFYAVTGRPPFDGATIYDVMKQQSSSQLPDPRQFNPAISATTHQLIWRMMAKARKLRPRTAGEVAEAISSIQSGATSAAVKPPVADQPAPAATEGYALDEGGAAGKDAAGDELLAEMRSLLEALQTPDASGKLSRTVLKRVNLIDQRLAAIRGFLARWEDYGGYVERARQRAPLTADDEGKFAAVQAEIAGQYGAVLPLLAQWTRGGRVIQNCRDKTPLSALPASPAVAEALDGSVKAGARILRDFADFLAMARRKAISQNLIRYSVERYGRTSWGMTIAAVLAAGFLFLIGWLIFALPARYAMNLSAHGRPPETGSAAPANAAAPGTPLVAAAAPPKQKTIPAAAKPTVTAPPGQGHEEGMTERPDESLVEAASHGAAPRIPAPRSKPASPGVVYGNTSFLRLRPEDFDWPDAAGGKARLAQHKLATNGVYGQVKEGWQITKCLDMRRPDPCYVFVRCPPTGADRPFIVQFGLTVAGPVEVGKNKGQAMRWVRIGPFSKLVPASACELTLMPTTGYDLQMDQVIVTNSADWRVRGEEVDTFPGLKAWDLPGEEVLADCTRINVDPPAYLTGHYIVQAPPERICKAVAWVKFVDATVYPTLVDILGYKPATDLHAVVFSHRYRCTGAFLGIDKFENTGCVASRIYIQPEKLDRMPPYQASGGVAWETIHGLLDEAKRKADWKPIWKAELLDLILEMEMLKRLHMQRELDDLCNSWVVTQRSGPRYAEFGEFWKQYGWQPFQKLLVKLHEDPGFKPTLDEGTFVYEMSLGAGKDVSAFFEERGWTIPPETKTRIKEQLNHQ